MNTIRTDDTPNPFISVCIPTFNRENYLQFAIESALSQKYPNFEVVVIDDGSTDGTRNVLQKYSFNRSVRIVYKLHTNAPDTRNRAVAEAKGDYLLWLDSDDILYPNLLERYSEVLKNYPGVDAIYCNLVSIGDETGVIHKYQNWQNRQDDAIRYLLYGSPIPNPGLLIKRSILQNFRYDTSFRRAHDYELWSRILLQSNIAPIYIPEVLVQYRIHAGNLSGRMKPEIDVSFDSRIVQNVLAQREMPFFFPQFNWADEWDKSMDIAYLNIALKFISLNDLTCALNYINKIKDESYRQKFEPFLQKYKITQ